MTWKSLTKMVLGVLLTVTVISFSVACGEGGGEGDGGGQVGVWDESSWDDGDAWDQ